MIFFLNPYFNSLVKVFLFATFHSFLALSIWDMITIETRESFRVSLHAVEHRYERNNTPL